MIAAETRSNAATSNKTKATRVTQPLLKSGICSKLATPIPPSTSATRHESLSRRNRKTGILSASRSSTNGLNKLENVKNNTASAHRNLGLEVRPEQVVWKGWEPGEEYTKNLTLKNIHIKTQKIKYKVPSSRFFSTLFPQVIVLSAGTSFTLPVTFRPLDKEKYEDKIEFSTNQGSFSISLQALLPEMSLHLPESIHFGLSAVHDTMELTFEMRNMSSELTTNYAWEVPEPFTIIPPSGTLLPRASSWMRAIFRPSSARVFEASVICFYGGNMRKTMKLEGIGKYPHLLISTKSKVPKDTDENTSLLSFGSVNVHQTSEKMIVLHNLSNVKAPFKLCHTNGTSWMDRTFTCCVTEGDVPPMGCIRLPINYTPHLVNNTNIDYFEVSAIGNISKSTLQCIGSCVGPKVTLSTSVINFGVVQPDKTSTQTLQMHNESNCEAIFQIDLDGDSGVFRINNNSGVLPPHQSTTLILTFTPPYSINYHRRAVVLIHEQEPVFLELIGTSHSEECKPPHLKCEHMERYRVHVSRGLSFYSPEVLHNQLKEGRLVKDSRGCLMLPNDDMESANEPIQSSMSEYFDDGHNTDITHNPPHVALDQISIWIGEVQYEATKQGGCHVTLQLTNHTRGKVTAMWVADPSGVFEVLPSSCDVPPMKSTDFRVIFRPNAPNQFFGKQLECYAFYKCMRDYRLVEDQFVCPPWLLTVDVAGHTFNGKNETFLPEASVCTEQLTFPAVTSGESSYRTILLENKGTAPLLYQFLKGNDSFTVKPCHGLARSKYHISVARNTPTKVDTYEGIVTLRLNDNAKHDKKIKLVGTGEQPELLLGNGGEMFFRPTCVGTSNVRDYDVRNVGRLPVKFKWMISHADAKCLSVAPIEGVMHANQIQNHKWTFKPRDANKHVFKPTCLTWPYNASSNVLMEYSNKEGKRFSLRVIGEGSEGDIKAERCTIDFGCVVSGSSTAEPLVLYNNSQCDLHFRLSVEQTISSQYGEDPDEEEPIGLKLSQWQAVLPARSRTTITAMARPYRRVVYKWSLFYELLSPSGESINPDCKVLLCELSADGVFPTLAIIDARSSGSGSNISKTQLWRWFSLEHLNSCLDSDPNKAELVYSVATRHSTSRRPSVYTKSIMDFNFGAAAFLSEPCYVSMMVKNTGSVSTEWAFLFPKDLELEIDYWAESGLFDPDELHELHIQDNKLFTVYPSKGVLNPGESKTILLTYKHDVPGTHRLPVLFKIEKGKEILLNFIGVTVETNRRYLHFPGTKHIFTPVPIGGPTPPKQLYEMYNGGSMAVIYEVDMAPLHLLETDNFDHPIFTCLNPRGEIAPGACANLEWIFSPLESKTYVVDIPIHIVGGDTALITFKGVGYDGRAMGSSMPMLDQPPEYTAVPSSQKVPVPGQLLFMSEERISFGNIPLFGRARHVIFLTNKSEDRPVSYSWHATSEVVNDVLRVEPVQGYLSPGQTAMTKVAFCAAGQPSFYDLDLICEVVDEIKMAEYHTELSAWEDEHDRQAVEFVITDDDDEDDMNRESSTEFHAGPSKFVLAPSPRRNLENILNKRTPPLRLTESQVANYKVKSERKSFQTLPPIRFEDPVQLPSNRSRMLRKKEAIAKDEWIQPQPPKPFIGHLGVTARTHDIAQFRTNFSSESNKYFIDRTLQIDYPVRPKSSSDDQYPLTTCNDSEKAMVMTVMSDVIRGLLDDPTFHEAVQDLENNPVPFFGQIPRDEELEEADERRKAEQSKSTEEEEVTLKSKNVTDEVSSVDIPAKPSSIKLMDEILKQGDGSRPSTGGELQATPRGSDIDGRSTAQLSVTQNHLINEQIKRSPQFGTVLEDVLSCTIANIMDEALKGEVLLTARPRVVALPPSRVPSATNRPPSSSGASRKSGSAGSQRKILKKNSSRASNSSKR